jgi:cytochrome P450
VDDGAVRPAVKKSQYFEMDEDYSYLHAHGERVIWLDYDQGMWLVGGHKELAEILSDDESFSSAHDLPNGRTPFRGVMAPATPVRAVPIELDPPEYHDFRRLLAPKLNPASVRALLPRVAEYTDWCLDQVIESGRSDLFNDLIKVVPAMVTLHLIGLPVEDAAIASSAVHRTGPTRFGLNPIWAHLYQRLKTAVDERRDEPGDDLISYLVQARVGGRELTDMQIFEIAFTLIVGGMSTTAKLLLGAFSYYGVHQADRARALADPREIPVAIEEFLRYYSPVSFLSRTATRDMCIAGKEIKKNDRVALGFAAANRDPQAFDDPNSICIGRAPNRHLAFGHGMHFCLGSALGRSEAAVVIEKVLSRIPDYELAPDTGPAGGSERRSRWGKRLRRGLPVTFSPGAPAGPAGPGATLPPGFSLAELPEPEGA